MASTVGAVMMLRGGRMGLPAEYLPGRREDDVVGALLAAQDKAHCSITSLVTKLVTREVLVMHYMLCNAK